MGSDELSLTWLLPSGSITEPFRSLLVFAVLLVGGETTLVPVMALAVAGWYPPAGVLVLLAAATIVSDSVWYALGRVVVRPQGGVPLSQRAQRRIAPFLTRLRDPLHAHAAKIVFFSKFIFGTRWIVQVVCGAVGVPYIRYVGASVAGVLVWGVGVWGAVGLLAVWVPPEKSLRWFSVGVVGIFLLVLLLHAVARRWWVRLMRQALSP